MCPSIQKLGSQDCVTRQEVGQRRQALLVGWDSHLIVPVKPELSSWLGLGLQQWIGNSWDQIQETSLTLAPSFAASPGCAWKSAEEP